MKVYIAHSSLFLQSFNIFLALVPKNNSRSSNCIDHSVTSNFINFFPDFEFSLVFTNLNCSTWNQWIWGSFFCKSRTKDFIMGNTAWQKLNIRRVSFCWIITFQLLIVGGGLLSRGELVFYYKSIDWGGVIINRGRWVFL